MLFTRGRRGRDGDRLASLQAENETLRAEIKRKDEESSRLRGEIGTREERIGRLGAESEERGNSVALLRTHIENLHAFSKKLVSIGTLDEIYRFVADVCIEVFEFDRINILAADEEAKMLRCVEARGNLDEPREKIRAPIGPEAGALYWSYAEGRVIVLDLGTKEAPQKVPEKYYIRPPWSDIRAFRSQSFIIGALLGREKPVGVFAIDKKLRRKRVTPDDIGLVKLLRDIASYAIQNVQTVEGLKVRQAGIYDLIRTSLGAATQGKEKAERTYVANQRLMDSSKRIAGITGAIEDLADRTNLLSLNAAIEAARAGDAGRGFGVVADEVKRLAGQTRESTREIGAVIEHIATEILSSGEAMNEIVSAQKNLIGSIEVLHEKASRLV